jgi:hypothetical protein
MKYIIFLTINLKHSINGNHRAYLGVHGTDKPNVFDGYIGDGINIKQISSYKYPKTPLQEAVKKYGVSSFKRIVLYTYDTAEEAYKKLDELRTKEFLNNSSTYNYITESYNKPIYQFNNKGELVKTWNNSYEICDFYGYSSTKLFSAIKYKCLFLNSYWSLTPEIKDYSDKQVPNIIYLYNIDGKLIKELYSKEDCMAYTSLTYNDVSKAILNQTFINGLYYISNKLTDLFAVKPRRSCIHQTFFVYKSDNTFVGKFVGKEIMNVIDCHSWLKISNVFTLYNNWYKDFYISLKEIDRIPNTNIDVYDKQGNFIEHISNLEDLKTKYKVTNYKRIQQGDKYFGDYIFKCSK